MAEIAKTYENGYNSFITVATAGQTTIDITNGGSYMPKAGLMEVFKNGIATAFEETHSEQIVLTVPAVSGDIIELVWYEGKMHPKYVVAKPEDLDLVSFETFKLHDDDTIRHVTMAKKKEWDDHGANGDIHVTKSNKTAWDAKETPEGAIRKIETQSFSTTKRDKDINDVYTVVENGRADGTMLREMILSGGTSPQYTTRTIKYYDVDGVTILKTEVFELAYDEDGMLMSEVLL